MGLGKNPSLGGQGRDKEDKNAITPVAKMVPAGETIGLRGKQMRFWSALGERKSEGMAGKVRKDQSMKAYVCHPTGTGKSLLRGRGRMPVLEQCMVVSVVDSSRAVRKPGWRMAVQAGR